MVPKLAKVRLRSRRVAKAFCMAVIAGGNRLMATFHCCANARVAGSVAVWLRSVMSLTSADVLRWISASVSGFCSIDQPRANSPTVATSMARRDAVRRVVVLCPLSLSPDSARENASRTLHDIPPTAPTNRIATSARRADKPLRRANTLDMAKISLSVFGTVHAKNHQMIDVTRFVRAQCGR